MWRRGTVPIWWGVSMKNGGLGDVDVIIAPNNPYQGTKRCAFVIFELDSMLKLARPLTSAPFRHPGVEYAPGRAECRQASM